MITVFIFILNQHLCDYRDGKLIACAMRHIPSPQYIKEMTEAELERSWLTLNYNPFVCTTSDAEVSESDTFLDDPGGLIYTWNT